MCCITGATHERFTIINTDAESIFERSDKYLMYVYRAEGDNSDDVHSLIKAAGPFFIPKC